MDTDLLSQGLVLLALGMGTVFIFLTLLVLVTGLMSSLVMKYFPLPPPPARQSAEGREDSDLVAVISAAIQAHRSRGKSSKE